MGCGLYGLCEYSLGSGAGMSMTGCRLRLLRDPERLAAAPWLIKPPGGGKMEVEVECRFIGAFVTCLMMIWLLEMEFDTAIII